MPVGRFAPTPTGDLHAGSLIAALASRCQSKRWLVRIDDIDTPRIRIGSEASILAALARFGFTDNRTLVARQSDRLDSYRRALEALADTGALFACRCSRRELAGESTYPGTCRADVITRERLSELLEADAPLAMRLRLAGRMSVHDIVQGASQVDLERDVGDPIVRRRDGIIAYQLATAVDDSDGIDEVVRGADLLDATAVQVALMQRLGRPVPRFAHLPVAVDVSGRKLGKSSGASAAGRGNAASLVDELTDAWRFLGQQRFDAGTIEEFWHEARRRWCIAQVPRKRKLPFVNGPCASRHGTSGDERK